MTQAPTPGDGEGVVPRRMEGASRELHQDLCEDAGTHIPRSPLSEVWLRSTGFTSSQGERQPHKHWTLKLGWAVDGGRFSTPDDLQIEVTPAWWTNRNGERVQAAPGEPWYCWVRGDGRGMVHIRHLQFCDELTRLIEAMTGQPWAPENVVFGLLHTPERAAQIRAEDQAREARLAARAGTRVPAQVDREDSRDAKPNPEGGER